MSPSPNMIALYNRPVMLWVEDPVTSAYLSECWEKDPDIGILIAGGSGGIRTVVKASRQDGHHHVFGFVDRDFGKSNHANWFNGANEVFVPTAHEVENYFLESAHLASCGLNTAGRSAADILARLLTKVSQMVWWMACRKVLKDLRAEIIDSFPANSFVATQQDAEKLILTSPWFTNLAPQAMAITAPGEVAKRLTDAHALMTVAGGSGEWKRDFSGKDLFHDVRDWLYQLPTGLSASAAEKDRDLAISIAQWQVANHLVPQEVSDLRAALRKRIGLPP